MATEKQLLRVIKSLQQDPRQCQYCPCKKDCPAIEQNNGKTFTKKIKERETPYTTNRRTITVNKCVAHRIKWIADVCDEKGRLDFD